MSTLGSKELLVLRLNAICKCLNTLYNINWGGCCWIAYCIADILHNKGINYTLVICDEFPVTDFKKLDCSVNHIYIEVDGESINKGDFESCEISKIHNVSPEEIENYYNKGRWCSIYNRYKNTFIQKLINDMINNV